MQVGLIIYFSLNRPILKVCQFTVVHWSSTWNTSLASLNRWIYSNLNVLSHQCSCDYCILLLLSIDLSVSPSPRTQTSQWQFEYQLHGEWNSDIFRFQCHRETLEDPKLASVLWGLCFKNGKTMCLGSCNTDYRYPERMVNIIYFITFPESKQNRAKCLEVFNPNTNEDKNVHFLVVIHSLSYNFHLLKQNDNVILCFSKVFMAKTS